MALVHTLGYTNTTPFSTAKVTPVDVDLATNYIKKPAGTTTYYQNKTGPAVQKELVEISVNTNNGVTNKLDKVWDINDPYLASPKTWRARGLRIRLECKVRETSTVDDTHIVDIPVVGTFEIAAPNSEAVDYTLAKAIYERIGGMVYNDDASGTNNFDRWWSGDTDLS